MTKNEKTVKDHAISLKSVHIHQGFALKSRRDLKPYDGNSRTHTDEQIDQVVASMKEFGFTTPLLVDENDLVIAGHARLEGAEILEMDLVPCIVLEGLSESQKRAYVIADNKLSDNSDWDFDILRSELEFLEGESFELDLLGFSESELDELLDIEADLPDLPSGDREPYQQKTFTVHDEQAAVIDEAIKKAKNDPSMDTSINENSNGNAIALICEKFLEAS